MLADDDSLIASGSGAVAIGAGATESKGLAGSLSINLIDNKTRTIIENSRVTTGGDVTLQADSAEAIDAVALSGAGAQGSLTFAVSLAVNDIGGASAATEATIRDQSVVTAGGSVMVAASDSMHLAAVSGTLAVTIGLASTSPSPKTGVGVALGFNTIASFDGTQATIDDSDVAGGDDVAVQAETTSVIGAGTSAFAVVLGGASAGALAMPISVSASTVATTTRARIARRRQNGISAGGNVTVQAKDETDIVTLTGSAAISVALQGGTVVGPALGFNIVHNSVLADLDSTTVTAGGHVLVDARDNSSSVAIATSGAITSGRSFTGSLAFNITDNLTRARIEGSGTVVTADGNVVVSAQDAVTLGTGAGQVSIGGLGLEVGAGGFGVANATTLTSNQVLAAIADHVTVQANGNHGTSQVLTGDIDARRAAVSQIRLPIRGGLLTDTPGAASLRPWVPSAWPCAGLKSGGGVSVLPCLSTVPRRPAHGR